MVDSFIIMTKGQILLRLEKAKKVYEERLPAWKDRLWNRYYEINEKKRAKWFHHFGLSRGSLSLEEFKNRARKDYEKNKGLTNFIGTPKYLWGHPTDADRGPSNVEHSGIPAHFEMLVSNSIEENKIYVSSSDLEDLEAYENRCRCPDPYTIYNDRFGWL